MDMTKLGVPMSTIGPFSQMIMSSLQEMHNLLSNWLLWKCKVGLLLSVLLWINFSC